MLNYKTEIVMFTATVQSTNNATAIGKCSSTRKGTSAVPAELHTCFAMDLCGSRDSCVMAYGIPKDWDLVVNEYVFPERNYLSLFNQLWIPPE